MNDLTTALLASPLGVTLLGRLEGAALDAMSFGDFLTAAINAGWRTAGPWAADASTEVAAAYEHAASRRSIAEAIEERFGAQLDPPFDGTRQEWWTCDHVESDDPAAQFGDLTRVYGNGEFPWAALRTVTEPPPECHHELAWAWEMGNESISRWRLPIRDDARVWQIHRPADWVALVERFPKVATRGHDGWELRGANAHLVDTAIFDAPNQHAACRTYERHVLPDWVAVAEEFDGVHLSWAGWLTTEGFVSDLPGGGVTMLRYWFSDRTFWLRDVFGKHRELISTTNPY